eukprot:Gregarina_sp_Pseudo_9__388@NODE_1253_length_1741_cov_18_128672_g1178_i0_p1_GENE_NODE_1253_length_1741_cov_18_128672_g1178_i0NODE_1253_length_1741_cov_18_128672_g1178_i0_p1_ORF_typecomplete_len463_score127_38UNC93/PF05978_16/1_9e11UNC93/PF05978_16/2_2e03UNC93/PF05978_16/4_4e03MFS_1/PF07690_16/3_5e07DUF543/PF04418_12/1_7_NODE_1253_length_1741_cov_18_128672_g1178_i03171705
MRFKRHWPVEDVKTQVILLGVLGAFCPGFYNGLYASDGMGDAHLKSLDLIANSLTYGLFGVCSASGGVLLCLSDLSLLLSIGGCSYGVFACLMFVARRYALVWLAGVAGAILGVGAALHWVLAGGLLLAYAPDSQRGYYAALYWGIFNLGAAGAAVLKLVAVVSARPAFLHFVRWLLITLTCVAGVAIPRLIRDPREVKVSPSHALIVFHKPDATAESLHDEASSMLQTLAIPEMILMSLLFVGSLWTQSYHSNFIVYFLTTFPMAHLMQVVHWLVQASFPFLFALALDCPSWSLRRRGLFFFHLMALLWVVTWTVGAAFQYLFEGGYDKDWPPVDRVHWDDPLRAMHLVLLAALFGVAECATEIYIYWFLGLQANNNVMRAIRHFGYFKGLQSLGNSISWTVDLFDRNTYRFQMWTCVAHFLLDLPLTFIAAINIHDMDRRRRASTDAPSSKTPALHMPLI